MRDEVLLLRCRPNATLHFGDRDEEIPLAEKPDEPRKKWLHVYICDIPVGDHQDRAHIPS